ncbi:vanin-like protein 3 [Aphomia sociella]
MRLLFSIMFCFLCYNLSLASNTYRAGIVTSIHSDPTRYTPFIAEAAKHNVDILVLQSPEAGSAFEEGSGSDNYDEFVKTLSEATKQAGLYVVAHLYENVRCQNKNELVRSNLVFDRDGSIVSVYRKPLNNLSNCTLGGTDAAVFTTDFDVTFGLLMEEDLVLQNPEDLNGLKNFVVTGSWPAEITYLTANHFSSSWAYVNKVNVISVGESKMVH